MVRILERITDELISTVPEDRLKILMKYPAYRGEWYREEFDVKSYPKNRKPSDNNYHIQRKVDSILESMGFKALRSNSIFVTGDWDFAKEFARNQNEVRFIIPAGTMHFVWTPHIKDLMYHYIEERFGDFVEIDWDCVRKTKVNAAESFSKFFYRIGNIAQSVVREKICPDATDFHDMEECIGKKWDLYIDELLRHPHIRERMKKLIILNDLDPKYGRCTMVNPKSEFFTTLKDNDFARALKSGHEIMITGDYYYSVNPTFFENSIRPFLEKKLK